MEERSLRVYEQKTFFSKIGTTISKILIPTKIGFNGMMISVCSLPCNAGYAVADTNCAIHP